MMTKGAKFSPDRFYRYRLWRIWDRRKGLVLFIGLNPSTADENVDDPTIRRCIGFTMDWGYGGLLFGNLFAYRNTYPEQIKMCAALGIDPIGPENDAELRAMNAEATLTVLCWGNDGAFMDRGTKVYTEMFPAASNFGFTKQAQPKHPLYLPKNAPVMHLIV